MFRAKCPVSGGLRGFRDFALFWGFTGLLWGLNRSILRSQIGS
ncbi:MAG: hypothetical protein OXI59_19175 [Gemmatimonadota bacterium]|nr:hypothetical protein [Gemmatimonadota bacterium]